jgi:hypothetical protein
MGFPTQWPLTERTQFRDVHLLCIDNSTFDNSVRIIDFISHRLSAKLSNRQRFFTDAFEFQDQKGSFDKNRLFRRATGNLINKFYIFIALFFK